MPQPASRDGILAEKVSTVAGQIAAINSLPEASRTGRALLFSRQSRHFLRAVPSFHLCFCRRTIGALARKELEKMRQLRSLLRAAPSRIGRRLAEIVAIAAASLPAAGA